MIYRCFTFSLLFCIPFCVIADNEAAVVSSSVKAVLVTGASTGIGRNITERLASEGYFVYAGARKEKDLRELDAIENVQSIRLDVTIQDEIDSAVETITKAGRGLHGIVNNAGVIIVGPLIEVEESELDFLFDVNIYGPYRITKAFSPLIIEAKGRIVNISSISGILSGTLVGPYSMSKHAIEAYTDSLATEMAKLGVSVSAVEPGNYKSRIAHSMLKRMKEQRYSADQSLFQEDIERMMDYLSSETLDPGPEPVAVTDAVLHALFDENPKPHYMVVPNQRQAEFTIRKAIEELVELNRDHAYSYDRNALVGMLDEALAEPEE